jgi:hypothetical protein
MSTGKASPTSSSLRVETEKDVAVAQGADTFPDIDERKLLRKMDWALIPWLSFLYLLSFLDRTSIGNAKVCA